MKFYCSQCGQELEANARAPVRPVVCPACGAWAAPPNPDADRRSLRRAIITGCVLVLLALLFWLVLPRGAGFGGALRTGVFGSHLAGGGTGAGVAGNQRGSGGPASSSAPNGDPSSRDGDPLAQRAGDQPNAAPRAAAPGPSPVQAARPENATNPVPVTQAVPATNVGARAVVLLNPGPPPTSAVRTAAAPGFFGALGKGSRFVYVVDRSGSMKHGDRFDAARAEVLKSLRSLKPGMMFFVIFYDHRHEAMPATTLQPAARVAEFVPWIERQQTRGGTNPKEAMISALKLNPDTIWLLSDGQFSDAVLHDIRLNNPGRKITINTISFHDPSGEPVLRQIAHENNGEYRHVPPPPGSATPWRDRPPRSAWPPPWP